MKTLLATGLLASFITGSASADLLWSTSFEDVNDLGAKYYDTGDVEVAHWLSNNEGQAAVNGDGFSAWYEPFANAGVGLGDGDYFGVTTYSPSGMGGSYDGDQHYQMSDIDGFVELHFDGYNGSASMVSMAIFIQTQSGSAGYESTDSLSIHWGSDPVNGTLASWDGVDGDGNGSVLEDASGSWMFLSYDVSELGEGHLHIRGASNSGTEAYFIDSVSIMGTAVPTPGALALLGLAGIASRRRRK